LDRLLTQPNPLAYIGVGSAKHESKQYYAHHYNLVSPAKQSNFHQHSQAVFRPQPNVSRVKPKPINEENVQHISNLSCANKSVGIKWDRIFEMVGPPTSG
jgi:hypothetical protein